MSSTSVHPIPISTTPCPPACLCLHIGSPSISYPPKPPPSVFNQNFSLKIRQNFCLVIVKRNNIFCPSTLLYMHLCAQLMFTTKPLWLELHHICCCCRLCLLLNPLFDHIHLRVCFWTAHIASAYDLPPSALSGQKGFLILSSDWSDPDQKRHLVGQEDFVFDSFKWLYSRFICVPFLLQSLHLRYLIFILKGFQKIYSWMASDKKNAI